MVYYCLPSALSTISSTWSIADDFIDGVVAMAMEDYHSKFAVDQLTPQGVVKMRDYNAVKYWAGKVSQHRIDAKRQANSYNSTALNVINYGMGGIFNTPKKVK